MDFFCRSGPARSRLNGGLSNGICFRVLPMFNDLSFLSSPLFAAVVAGLICVTVLFAFLLFRIRSLSMMLEMSRYDGEQGRNVKN